MAAEVQFSNMPEADSIKIQRVKDIATKHHEKFRKLFGEEASLKINFKESRTTKSGSLHSVSAMLALGSKKIFSTDLDWDLIEAVNKALSKLQKEAMKTLKKR